MNEWKTGHPSNDRKVLVCTSDRRHHLDIKIGYWIGGCNYSRWVTQGTAKVVAWMELPSLPKVDYAGNLL